MTFILLVRYHNSVGETIHKLLNKRTDSGFSYVRVPVSRIIIVCLSMDGNTGYYIS